jgi:general secretion pathway protein D
VPVTTFIPLAAGTVNQQPITSFEYKNVGVNIDITPRVHDEGDVTLDLKLEISSLSASIPVAGVQELPTFNSRSVSNRIRLHDGETSILAGLISDTERNSLTGIPGLSDLPLIGHLFSRNRREVSQTDIVMTLRPHIVAQPAITDEDRRAFPLSNEAPPLLFDVPSMPASSPTTRPVDATSPRIEPIRPPAATTTPTPYPSR